MLRGYALILLLLACARAVAAQQPASATSSQTSTPMPCPAPPSSAQSSAQPPQQTPPSDAWHCVTVTFDYDFSKTPPCPTTKPVHPCADHFSIFETTAGLGKDERIPLFEVPLPPKPKRVVTRITQQSPKQIDFELGWHKLCVAALDVNGRKSTLRFCDSCGTWIWVQAGPTPTPSTPTQCSSTSPPATPPPAPAPPPANP
jgi:hypothetical protein